MGRKTKEQKFTYEGDDGKDKTVTLNFTQLDPREGVRLAIRFGKLIGGPLGKLVSAIEKIDNTEDIQSNFDFDMDNVGQAVEKLFTNLDEEESLDTIDRLFKTIVMGNASLSWNADCLQGNTKLALQVAKISAEVNFGDFFHGASGALGKVKALGASILEKRTSTGTPGGPS